MIKTVPDQLDSAKSRRKAGPDQLGLGLGEWGVRLLPTEQALPVGPFDVSRVPAHGAKSDGSCEL